MGFATIVLYTGLFMAVMIAMLGIGTTYTNYLEESKEIIKAEKEYINLPVLEITGTTYADDVTRALIENKGRSPLELDSIDIYLDGQFIPRNSSNRTLTLLTDPRNPGLWDPGEVLEANITMELEDGIREIKASAGGTPDDAIVYVGTTEMELLANNQGQWNPIVGDPAFDAGELLAVNNGGGTQIVMNNTNYSASLEVENPTWPPIHVFNATILIDYDAPVLPDWQFKVEGRDSNWNGPILCSGAFGNTSGYETANVLCTTLTVDQLANLYIVLNNTDGRDIAVDYVRTEAIYVR